MSITTILVLLLKHYSVLLWVKVTAAMGHYNYQCHHCKIAYLLNQPRLMNVRYQGGRASAMASLSSRYRITSGWWPSPSTCVVRPSNSSIDLSPMTTMMTTTRTVEASVPRLRCLFWILSVWEQTCRPLARLQHPTSHLPRRRNGVCCSPRHRRTNWKDDFVSNATCRPPSVSISPTFSVWRQLR